MFKPFRIVAASLAALATQSFAGVSGIYDANDVLVGEYAEAPAVIHSVHGYRFAVNADTGVVKSAGKDVAGANYFDAELLYSSANCTGQAYVGFDNSASTPAGGMMINAGNKGLYFIAKAPAVSNLAFASAYSSSTCNAIQLTLELAVPAQPNDPATTGVPNTPFMPPLRLEVIPLSQFFRLFRNGFETTCVDGPSCARLRDTDACSSRLV